MFHKKCHQLINRLETKLKALEYDLTLLKNKEICAREVKVYIPLNGNERSGADVNMQQVVQHILGIDLSLSKKQ